jgi:hypothetical protein
MGKARKNISISFTLIIVFMNVIIVTFKGYFNTPDLVLFANHDEIIAEIEEKIQYFS